MIASVTGKPDRKARTIRSIASGNRSIKAATRRFPIRPMTKWGRAIPNAPPISRLGISRSETIARRQPRRPPSAPLSRCCIARRDLAAGPGEPSQQVLPPRHPAMEEAVHHRGGALAPAQSPCWRSGSDRSGLAAATSWKRACSAGRRVAYRRGGTRRPSQPTIRRAPRIRSPDRLRGSPQITSSRARSRPKYSARGRKAGGAAGMENAAQLAVGSFALELIGEQLLRGDRPRLPSRRPR